MIHQAPALLWPAAVLRQPTLPALSAVLDDAGSATATWAAWQTVTQQSPDALDDRWRQRTLHHLRHDQPVLCRLWQQRALDYFRQCSDTAEQLYHFDQLADALLVQQAYEDLARLLDQSTLPAVPQATHLRTYLTGVLACERHAHAEATTTFEHLLVQPDIDPTLQARLWNSLGVNAQYLGRYDQALKSYCHACDLFVAQGNLLGQAKALFNLGTAHRHLGELPAAASAFQESLVLLEQLEARDWQTFALNGLGLVDTGLGRWAEAEQIYRRVAVLCESVDDREGAGIAYNNLGELFLFTGRWDSATAALDAAGALVSTPLSRIEIQLNQGLRSMALHDLPAAAVRFQAAHTLATQHRNVRYQILALYLTGNVLGAQHRDEEALTQYQQALALVETLRGQIEESDVRSHLFTTWQPVYMAAVLACVRLARPEEALTWAERARARAFFDLLGHHDVSQTITPARTPLDTSDICRRLKPATAALVYFCTGPGSARAHAPDNALTSILWPPPAIVGFTVSTTGVTAEALPLSPAVLEQRAFDHDGRALVALTPGENGQLLTPWVLRIGYDALLAPVLARFAASALEELDTLCIVPHGPLHRVPIQALPDPAGSDLLTRGFDVIVAPSLSAWLENPPSLPPARPDAVFGYAPDLVHAQAEAIAIARLLGVRPLVGHQARQAGFLAAARRARVLHCSCHGTFDRHAPLRSALHLADGCVTAADLLAAGSLPMDLVFLSACESGRSEVEGADELMGLVRAFLLGGTRAVVVSLWRVDELSTRVLAELFYEAYVGDQQPPARALRLAQLGVRNLTLTGLADRLARDGLPGDAIDTTLERLVAMNATWSVADHRFPLAHPYFWAGFVVVGS